MLTLLEQTVENCCRELEDRLKPLIKEKEIIKGEEQAVSNQTIMQIIVSDFIPKWTRMRFRLLEQEKDFVIEIYDAQGEQEMKPVVIRFKYEYDWGLETWEDALKLSNEDRHKYFTKWTNDGFTPTQIGNRFGLESSNVYGWLKRSSKESYYAKQYEKSCKSSTIAYMRRIWLILEEAGMGRYCFKNMLSDAYKAVTGKSLSKKEIKNRHASTAMSSDIDTCLQIAIDYIQRLICQIEILNSETYTNKSMRGFINGLSRSTGISLGRKQVFDQQKYRFSLIDHEGLEKCLVFCNNILEKLNQTRKELAA